MKSKNTQTFYFRNANVRRWLRLLGGHRELKASILARQLLVHSGEGLKLVLDISAVLGIKVYLPCRPTPLSITYTTLATETTPTTLTKQRC
jgi:hypothetical protein